MHKKLLSEVAPRVLMFARDMDDGWDEGEVWEGFNASHHHILHHHSGFPLTCRSPPHHHHKLATTLSVHELGKILAVTILQRAAMFYIGSA